MRGKFYAALATGFALIISLLFTTWPSSVGAQTTPVLMVLRYLDNGQLAQTEVQAIAGQTLSPFSGKALSGIAILPGNAIESAQRPEDLIVEFYRGADTERALVCSITLRYFRDGNGLWAPHFQLNEDVFVKRGPDGRWKPITSFGGAPSLIVITSSTLPNPEGFYPALEFGLTNGMLQIDSWVTRQL